MVANGELGGVNSDRQAANAGVDIVSAERTLAAKIHLAITIEGQGMGGNDAAAP